MPALVGSHSYHGAYLRRQWSRLGAPKAITATAHKLARIIYNLMRYGLAYSRQEESLYAEQVRARLEKQLHRRAKELGFSVVKVEAPPASSVDPSPEVAANRLTLLCDRPEGTPGSCAPRVIRRVTRVCHSSLRLQGSSWGWGGVC